MVNNLKIAPVHSILTSKNIDLSSMQIFDIQGLLVKQDKQIRELSKYIFDNCKLTIEVNVSDTEIWFVGKRIATVSKYLDELTIKFDRPVFNAYAYDKSSKFDTEVSFDTVVVSIPSSTTSITLTVL